MLRAIILATTVTAVVGTSGFAVPVAAQQGPTAPVHVEGGGGSSLHYVRQRGFHCKCPSAASLLGFLWRCDSLHGDRPKREHGTRPADPDDVIITGVRYVDRRNPAAGVHVLLRTVTPRMVRNQPNLRDRFGTFYAVPGHAGQRQRYGTYVPGRYSTDIARVRGVRRLREGGAQRIADGPGEGPRPTADNPGLRAKLDSDGVRLHHWFVD